MFERATHRAIAVVLEAFDLGSLERFACYFAGGTRIALEHGEFRESRDADFLCSSTERFAEARMAVRSRGYAALFTQEGRERLRLPREIRADQYGIRSPALAEDRSVRVELIREARFALSPRPGAPSYPALAFRGRMLRRLGAPASSARRRSKAVCRFSQN